MRLCFVLCGVLLFGGCADEERHPFLEGPGGGLGGSSEVEDGPDDDVAPGDAKTISGKLCVVSDNLILNACPTQLGEDDIDFSQFTVSQLGTSQSTTPDKDDGTFTLSVVGTDLVDLKIESDSLDAENKPSLITAKIGGTNQSAPILDPAERIQLFNEIGIGETNGTATVVLYSDFSVLVNGAETIRYKHGNLWDTIGPSENGVAVALGVVVQGGKTSIEFLDGNNNPFDIPVALDTTTFVVGP